MQAIRPLLLILFLVLNVTTILGHSTQLLASFEDDNFKTNCLISVFDEYIRPLLSSNGKILVNLPHSELTVFQHDHILRMFYPEFGIIVNGWMHPQQKCGTKIDTYVLFCTNIAEVSHTIKLWKSCTVSWNPTASVLVFHNDTSESYENIKKILMLFKKNKILNVNVISVGAIKIEIVTWSPHEKGSCGKCIRNLKIVAECMLETSSYHKTYREVEMAKFPVIVLNKCPIKAICYEWAPYTFYSSAIGSYSGFEVEVLKAFADKMNFKPIFIGISDGSTKKPIDLLNSG